ncbi:malate dehydrogenase, cytoplasmic-like [Tubulanus polymorphus]|uniref:malate dehydrogenase, cytoplasmic-like n=1 Tax=Tubulanus polymorphus TaxID=672921 RepID=UPI003DA261BA
MGSRPPTAPSECLYVQINFNCIVLYCICLSRLTNSHYHPEADLVTTPTGFLFRLVRNPSKMAETLKIVVTGAAGQIAYSLLYSIAKGDVFGKEQKMELVLLDILPMMEALNGVVMELQDCALPLLTAVHPSADANSAFQNADVGILVGAFPRKEGMERKDLLKANAKIFKSMGEAIEANAKKTIKVIVVGNPANTNAMLCSHFAPSVQKRNFSALTRLDHNRAQSQVAMRLGVAPQAVKKVIIWGNHSSTQYPDLSHSVVNMNGAEVSATEALKDDNWVKGEFLKTVQTRGAAIIKARKLSSALSAAKAICDHMRNWWCGTPEGNWVSMAVPSDGSYGIPEGVIYSYPVTIDANRDYKIVQGLEISDFSREKMDKTYKELAEEKETAMSFVQ